MKNDHQEPLEQLNIETPVETTPEEEAVLEELIREFGGWRKSEPEAEAEPETEAEPASEPEAPSPMEVVRVAAAIRAATQGPIDLTGDTIRFDPITEEQLAQTEEEEKPAVEIPEEPETPPDRYQRRAQRRSKIRLRKLELRRRRANRAAIRAARQEEPDAVYPSPEDACEDHRRVGSLRVRLLAAVAMCVLSLIALVLGSGPIGPLDLTGYLRGIGLTMMALLLAQSVLSYEIFVRGVYQALKLRFDLNSYLVLTVAIAMADGFFAIEEGRLPFCTAPELLLLVALWSVWLNKRAKWRTLDTALSMEEPVAAAKVEKAWHGLDCIFRKEGSLDAFTAMLETPDATQKTMRVYAPFAAVAALILAAFASIRGQGTFLWSWAAIMVGALPAGGFIACTRPFCILAGQLRHDGAAICGWKGAKNLSGECGIVIEDGDLFPKKNIALNGIKMYSELSTRKVVGYATAVIRAAGSGLLPLFEDVMKQEDGRHYTADAFHQYEGGGLGAEIRGDVVLLGSLAFMRLMGVQVPEGTRVQSALYISVNRELVGVFALTYQPSAGTRLGLAQVLHSAGLTPVLATRDFMITPALVKKRYKVSVDRVEFPVVAERVRLSSEEIGKNAVQGALMAKDSFLSFSSAVTCGRLLRRTAHTGTAVAVFSGLLGLLLMAVLAYLGSAMALSAANLTLFHLLWLVPTLLITGLIGKS